MFQDKKYGWDYETMEMFRHSENQIEILKNGTRQKNLHSRP